MEGETIPVSCSGLRTPRFVRTIFTEFEAKGDFADHDLGNRIATAIEKNDFCGDDLAEADLKAARAEATAFLFQPSDQKRTSPWNTYFRPWFSVGDKQFPDIKEIDVEVMAYWRRRMKEAAHPVSRARYSDLVWDLSKVATALKPPFEAVTTAIDNYSDAIELASLDALYDLRHRIRRAFQLAIGIGDRQRVAKVRDATFNGLSRLPLRFAWVEIFDLLIGNPKIELKPEQEAEIIAQLEVQLNATCQNTTGSGSFELKPVALRLSKYQSRKGQIEEARQAIQLWGQAVERFSKAVDGIVSLGWLSDVFAAYRDHGLKEDAKRVQLEMKNKGAEAEKQMIPLTSSVEIPAEEFEQFLVEITKGSAEESLECIALHFVPQTADVRLEMADTNRRYPLQSLFQTVKLADQQIVAKIGAADADPDGSLIKALSERLAFSGVFLSKSLDRAVERHGITPNALLAFVGRSVLFGDDDSLELVRHGVEAFFDGDHVKAIHVLIPQIEGALRRLLGMLGETTNKPRRGDSVIMVEKTLNDILEHEDAIKAALGEDVRLYLLAFLADPRGHNLRNRVSHGLQRPQAFRRAISDRVLHIVLLLGLIRVECGEPETRDGADEAMA